MYHAHVLRELRYPHINKVKALHTQYAQHIALEKQKAGKHTTYRAQYVYTYICFQSKNTFMFSKNAKHFSTSYHGEVLALDEALIDNDMVMADAIWRCVLMRDHVRVPGENGTRVNLGAFQTSNPKYVFINRNIYATGPVSAELIACTVKYVRRELAAIEKDTEFMTTGVIAFGDIIKPQFPEHILKLDPPLA